MVLRYVLQIFWIFICRSFIPTLMIQLASTIIGNLYIAYLAEKRYPFIREKTFSSEITSDEKRDLVTKIKAMLLYRVGAYVVNSTDNILISKFIGVVSVGIFSNYSMLLGLAKSITNYISSALTPSIGNQIETQSQEEIHKVFHTLYFMFFWLSSATTICFAVLLNPFIELWVGSSFLLPQ